MKAEQRLWRDLFPAQAPPMPATLRWADHGRIVHFTFLSLLPFRISGGLPISTAQRSVEHSCRGCEVSDITRCRLCVCPALNKALPCVGFSQWASLSNYTTVGLIRNAVHNNCPAAGSCWDNHSQQQGVNRVRVMLPTYSPSIHDLLLKDDPS